jgi:hypothetical protein
MSIVNQPLSAAAAHRILRSLAESDYPAPFAQIDKGFAEGDRLALAIDAVQEAASADEQAEVDTVIDLVRPSADELQVIFAEAAATVG